MCTALCSEIGSLMSLNACNSGASSDVREPISLPQAVCVYMWVHVYSLGTVKLTDWRHLMWVSTLINLDRRYWAKHAAQTPFDPFDARLISHVSRSFSLSQAACVCMCIYVHVETWMCTVMSLHVHAATFIQCHVMPIYRCAGYWISDTHIGTDHWFDFVPSLAVLFSYVYSNLLWLRHNRVERREAENSFTTFSSPYSSFQLHVRAEIWNAAMAPTWHVSALANSAMALMTVETTQMKAGVSQILRVSQSHAGSRMISRQRDPLCRLIQIHAYGQPCACMPMQFWFTVLGNWKRRSTSMAFGSS